MTAAEPERRLPPEIQALADWREGEAAWRRAELPTLAEAARAAGLATIGGQVQFRLPDGTCELYWQDYDPSERHGSESWPEYVDRSWSELLFLVEGLPGDEELIRQLRTFEIGREVGDAEARAALWFVVYLEDKLVS